MKINVTFTLDADFDTAAILRSFGPYLKEMLSVPEDLKDADPYNVTEILVGGVTL